jgi:hypothetical protein
MGVRKSKEENFQINGSLNAVIEKCHRALQIGGFNKISFNETINQFEAEYKQIIGTVWGEIKITLTTNGALVNVNAVAWANVDNIYALFSSPIDKILLKFKSNLY